MLFTLVPTSIDDAYGEAILSLVQAKAHLHVDGADEDDLIKALRNASIDMVQQYSGTRLNLTTGMVERFDDFGEGMRAGVGPARSEEHTSELQSLMRISYAVFGLKKKRETRRKRTRQNYKKKST